MTDEQWQTFFMTCTEVLGKGQMFPRYSETWCAWTTFGRLTSDCGYWTMGLPNAENVAETHIKDNGVWGQPFLFNDIAHIIIPKAFDWEIFDKNADPIYQRGDKTQNIEQLSKRLTELKIPHNLSEYCLDIKLF